MRINAEQVTFIFLMYERDMSNAQVADFINNMDRMRKLERSIELAQQKLIQMNSDIRNNVSQFRIDTSHMDLF